MSETAYSTNQQTEKTLTVYKASAGSGKTFTLAIEYIKLLLQDPYAYQSILAVTFTNKATEEMKMRILSQLYGLWKQLPDSANYMANIKEALGLDEKAISQKAELALRLLLHNYHYFKVQTIDTFFQSVLRNLARELQLAANLRVGLNTAEVVQEAVNSIIDSIADDKELMGIVKEYMEERISEYKSWNVIENMKVFGNTIFSEVYKQNRSRMDDVFANKHFFEDYKKKLFDIIRVKDKYPQIAQEVLSEMEKRGLCTDDFKGKSRGPIGYFLKLKTGGFSDPKLGGVNKDKNMVDSSLWYVKDSKRKQEIADFAEEILMPQMRLIEEMREKDVILYKSAEQTLKHINDIRLLRRIEEAAHNLNDASQRFMLSDTQSLLHEMIADDDSPFIFEKIGAYLKHVMIDEFQDTSTIQWKNFKVLLRECMSQGKTNLIVGDVKQSIYRFRSGDWHLLNDIHLDNELDQSAIRILSKQENWRSQMNVINFNNTFLRIIADIERDNIKEVSPEMAEGIERAYSDVEQLIPEKHSIDSGLVHIVMLPKKERKSNKDKESNGKEKEEKEKDPILELTLQNIQDLISAGIEQNEIAILVNKGKYIEKLAEYIENNSDVKIVSAEAFRLDASVAVNIIINAMKLLNNHNDKIALATLTKNYLSTVRGEKNIDDLMSNNATDLTNLLPEKFAKNQDKLRNMTLHNMAEELIRIFSLQEIKTETAYVTLFFDCLQNFTNDIAPTLDDFLQAWGSTIHSKTIESTESNGVRILTIHKSKGLEFNHVIIPYCDWNANPPGASTIWASPKEKPFSDLPLVPLSYRTISSLANTIYEPEGNEEHVQNIVDSLNLLYVAMTRAKGSLFIIGNSSDNKMDRSNAICKAINLLPDTINGIKVYVEGTEDPESAIKVTYGSLAGINKKEDSKKEEDGQKESLSKNVFLTQIKDIETSIHSYESAVTYRQSNESRRFAEDIYEEADKKRMIRMGTVLHEVFATIRTTDDVEPTLRRMEFDSTLYSEGMTREKLISIITERFNNPTIKDWFSDHWTIFNECSIVTPDGEQRPDRVMTDGKRTIVVDYKFGQPSQSHHAQVHSYMQLMQDMGMPGVEGYIWYIKENKIVKVESTEN